MLYGTWDISRNLLGLSSRSNLLRKDEFWAVSDVSFSVASGESLGIIGPNGAGKTTLLKMLNGIFWPDRGKITIRGKVGALIEIGAGFHPLLSGRENIYVNAAILGMTKKEVDKNLDSIIDFADIGDFINMPVKNYSSGMFVRLGFSVAAHCQTDILLVDEVLAVGDMAFSLKCHKKMSEYRQKGGTVLIVSHGIQLIRNVCKTAIWLNRGKIREIGDVHRVCDLYEAESIKNEKNPLAEVGNRWQNDSAVEISKVEFLDSNDQIRTDFKVGEPFKLRIGFACRRTVKNPVFTVSIFDSEGHVFSSNYSNFDGYQFSSISGTGHVDFLLDKLSFNPAKYICSITLSEEEVANILDWHEKRYSFTIAENTTNYGFFNPFPRWSPIKNP